MCANPDINPSPTPLGKTAKTDYEIRESNRIRTKLREYYDQKRAIRSDANPNVANKFKYRMRSLLVCHRARRLPLQGLTSPTRPRHTFSVAQPRPAGRRRDEHLHAAATGWTAPYRSGRARPSARACPLVCGVDQPSTSPATSGQRSAVRTDERGQQTLLVPFSRLSLSPG